MQFHQNFMATNLYTNIDDNKRFHKPYMQSKLRILPTQVVDFCLFAFDKPKKNRSDRRCASYFHHGSCTFQNSSSQNANFKKFKFKFYPIDYLVFIIDVFNFVGTSRDQSHLQARYRILHPRWKVFFDQRIKFNSKVTITKPNQIID